MKSYDCYAVISAFVQAALKQETYAMGVQHNSENEIKPSVRLNGHLLPHSDAT